MGWRSGGTRQGFHPSFPLNSHKSTDLHQQRVLFQALLGTTFQRARLTGFWVPAKSLGVFELAALNRWCLLCRFRFWGVKYKMLG